MALTPPRPELTAYAVQVCDFLDREAIPYALTGGMALAYWGYPRSTIDVDLVIAIDRTRELWKPGTVTPFMMEPDELIFPHMKVYRGLISAPSGDVILIDLLQVDSGWSKSILDRRVSTTLQGKNIWVSSAEDIILLKLFSPRERDKEDIHMLMQIRKGLIDSQYIADWSNRHGTFDRWNELSKQ